MSTSKITLQKTMQNLYDVVPELTKVDADYVGMVDLTEKKERECMDQISKFMMKIFLW